MALFQETHPLPIDPIAKRPLTPNDIEFLKELQHELNVQDSMGNRAPRFWVIKESKKTYVGENNDYEYVTITDEQNPESEIENLDELFDTIVEIASDRSYPYLIEKNHDGYIIITNTDTDSTDVICSITDETSGVLNDITGEYDRFKSNYIGNESRIVPDTLFLTHRACEEHLRKYGYNYSPDAHAYAMTADRRPEVERLMDLLQHIDFEQIDRLMALERMISHEES